MNRIPLPDGSAKAPDDEPRSRRLRPPQFRLSTMMALMAVLGVMFALMPVLGPFGMFWLVVFVLAALAHVAGNYLGNQLRDGGSRPGGVARQARDPVLDIEDHYAPTTRLGEKYSLGWSQLITTLVGTVLGAFLGVVWFWWTMREQASLANLALAMLAFAILGGIWTFLTTSLLRVVSDSISHALHNHRGDGTPLAEVEESPLAEAAAWDDPLSP